MMKRRGTAILTALVALAAAQAAYGQNEHFEPPTTHDHAPPIGTHAAYWTWRATPPNGTTIDVTYTVVDGTGGHPDVAVATAALDRAAGSWNGAGAFVNLTTTPSPNTMTVVLIDAGAFAPPVLSSGPSFDPDTHAGTFPDGTPFHQITGGSIVINIANASLNFDELVTSGAFWDFETLMVHELGHALGLGNADILFDPAGSVMFEPVVGTFARNLDPDDVAAASLLYGSPEPTTFVLFGMGLVAVGAASRRFRKQSAKS